MSHFIFDHVDFQRDKLLTMAEDVTEEMADIIPEGFNNNIRWHLGHCLVVLEKFAFRSSDLPTGIPDTYFDLFDKDTGPKAWTEQDNIPTLDELKKQLDEQKGRVREVLADRLEEKVVHVFSKPNGFKLETPVEYLTFFLAHESGHINIINSYKRLINKEALVK